MANAEHLGGGVIGGSRAQEEDICRRTTLYPALVQAGFPLEPDALLFTPNVKIVKDGTYRPVAAEERVNIDGVLTSAALSCPLLTASQAEYALSEDRDTMRLKVQMLLQMCAHQGLDHLVLGAWGCGAFQNPAPAVAALFREQLLGEFRGCFKYVTFAIRESGLYGGGLNACFRAAFPDTYISAGGPVALATVAAPVPVAPEPVSPGPASLAPAVSPGPPSGVANDLKKLTPSTSPPSFISADSVFSGLASGSATTPCSSYGIRVSGSLVGASPSSGGLQALQCPEEEGEEEEEGVGRCSQPAPADVEEVEEGSSCRSAPSGVEQEGSSSRTAPAGGEEEEHQVLKRSVNSGVEAEPPDEGSTRMSSMGSAHRRRRSPLVCCFSSI